MDITTTINAHVINFGGGEFSSTMAELAKDTHRHFASIPGKVVEKICRDFGSDYGRAKANSKVTIRFGKPNKDGRITLREACTLKGMAYTRPVAFARMVDCINHLGECHINAADSNFIMDDTMKEYIAELTAIAEAVSA